MDHESERATERKASIHVHVELFNNIVKLNMQRTNIIHVCDRA